MKITALLIFSMVISLTMPAHSAFAYGGGGGGHVPEAAGWDVSWTKNPKCKCKNVVGSSVWRGRRPKGPFEEGKSIQDAIDELIEGYDKKKYTLADVEANMRWAKRMGFFKKPEDIQHGFYTITPEEAAKYFALIKQIKYKHYKQWWDSLPEFERKIYKSWNKRGDQILATAVAAGKDGTPAQKAARATKAYVENDPRVKKSLESIRKIFGF